MGGGGVYLLFHFFFCFSTFLFFPFSFLFYIFFSLNCLILDWMYVFIEHDDTLINMPLLMIRYHP